MKKIILIIALFVFTLFNYSQSMRTSDYELYLKDYTINEVNISKGMYMTQNIQCFHEGKVEVNYIDSNTTVMVQFFFSVWDEKYKEFIVKDLEYKPLSPEFSFIDNNTLKYTNKFGKEISKTLKDNSTIENAILSSVLIWLNENEEKVIELEKATDTIKKVEVKLISSPEENKK